MSSSAGAWWKSMPGTREWSVPVGTCPSPPYTLRNAQLCWSEAVSPSKYMHFTLLGGPESLWHAVAVAAAAAPPPPLLLLLLLVLGLKSLPRCMREVAPCWGLPGWCLALQGRHLSLYIIPRGEQTSEPIESDFSPEGQIFSSSREG